MKESVPQSEKQLGIVSGTVVNERGEPVSDVTVSLVWMGPTLAIPRTDQSDTTGKFWFGHLQWGAYTLCARKEAAGYRENL